MKIENVNGSTSAIFNNGVTVYCNLGIIGINPELELYEGYDGNFCLYNEEFDRREMQQDEREELADYMIALWTKFKWEGK